MNAANKSMRQHSSVDLVNATILLMQMERDRFDRMREEAWRHESNLTPYGLKAADEISNEVPNYCLFDYNYEDKGDEHQYSVKGNYAGAHWRTVSVAKEAGPDGWIKSNCSCGVPLVDGLPCKHIIAVAKHPKKRFELNVVNSMPSWYRTSRWRQQLPEKAEIRCSIGLSYLKEKYKPDDSIHYCPDFAAPRKKGQPKKDASRRKSSLELAMEESKGAKKMTKKRVRNEKELNAMDTGDDISHGHDGCEGDI